MSLDFAILKKNICEKKWESRGQQNWKKSELEDVKS